ncbi:hypothetical protein GTGU 04676 [Babesia ovata]|uniref:Uncharacterized protein n=1 Tax=Babesia ovata TaxID=189622 RepID=A0A2H6K6D3_9APIC|nr:hypothetical protein GTGU 04676 [Babesia ovata]GBE58542.1 hypothetical protein GTGU 04676 [Babesia ovata]
MPLRGSIRIEMAEIHVVPEKQRSELPRGFRDVGAGHQGGTHLHEVSQGPLVEVDRMLAYVAVRLQLLVLIRLVQVLRDCVVQQVAQVVVQGQQAVGVEEALEKGRDLKGERERLHDVGRRKSRVNHLQRYVQCHTGVLLARPAHHRRDDMRPRLCQHLHAFLEVAKELVEVRQLEVGHCCIYLGRLVHIRPCAGLHLRERFGEQVDPALVVGHADIVHQLLQLGQLVRYVCVATRHTNCGHFVSI